MKIFGKFIINSGGFHEANFANLVDGTYVAVEGNMAYIETYNGNAQCNKAYVSIKSGYNILKIKRTDGSYLKLEEANNFVKDLAKKNLVELDNYGYAITASFDTRPDTISVTNDMDGDYNPIPLVVEGVNKSL